MYKHKHILSNQREEKIAYGPIKGCVLWEFLTFALIVR